MREEPKATSFSSVSYTFGINMMTSAPTKGRNTARLKTQVSNPVTSTVLLLYDDHEDYGQHCCRSEEQLAVVLYFSGLHGAKTLS